MVSAVDASGNRTETRQRVFIETCKQRDGRVLTDAKNDEFEPKPLEERRFRAVVLT